MTRASMRLQNNDQLHFEPARRAIRMDPAVGGASLVLNLRVSRDAEVQFNQGFSVNASVLVARELAGHSRQALCHVESYGLMQSPTRQGANLELVGTVVTEQLRALEEIRAGGDLWLSVRISLTYLDGEPLYLASGNAWLDFDVSAGEWAREIERVQAGDYVEVLVPPGDGEDYAKARLFLRESKALLRDGKIESAIVKAREAVEVVREGFGTRAIFADAIRKKPPERTLPERWACMVEDLFSTMSGAGHTTGVTADFVYHREDAVLLLAAASGMVKRLSRDRGV